MRDVVLPVARDGATGHRLPLRNLGLIPRETRELPVWYWPFEIINRVEARLLARRPVEFYTQTPGGTSPTGYEGKGLT